MTTDIDIGNRALEMIGSQVQITALNDGSPAGDAIGVLFQPTADLVMREIDPAFARRTAALTAAPVGMPVVPWAYEYLYPSDCLRVRQVRPAAASYDVNDPQPVRSQVALDIIATAPTKVILTNQASALAVYTSNLPTITQWDAATAEAVARRLAAPLAMALAGRPDFARELLSEAEQYAQMAEAIDEG